MDNNIIQQTPDEIVNRCLTDFRFFIETFISIKNKDRKIVPFMLNHCQNVFYDRMIELGNYGINKHFCLKSRQIGFSTLISSLFLTECILVPNTTAIVIAHTKDATTDLFRIYKGMYERLPDEIRPEAKYSSKTELEFHEINSRIKVGTAGSGEFGRGLTVNLLHNSEYALWENPETVLAALLESVPSNGKIIWETTAAGMGFFAEQYKETERMTNKERRARQLPYPHFFPWFEHDEYRVKLDESERLFLEESLNEEERKKMKVFDLDLEQIAFIRQKSSSQKTKFRQEYPSTADEAFISSGKPFFNLESLNNIHLWNIENKTWDSITTSAEDQEDPDNIKLEKGWHRREQEHILIYKNFKQGEKYILSVDPAEGNPNSDTSSAYLLRLNQDPIFVETVAEINIRIPMPKFYKLVYHLGSLFSFPKLVIERNNHGHLLNYWAENGFMQDQIKILNKYPNIYYGNDKKAGFVTSGGTRPLILDNLSESLANNMFVCYSKNWIEQARTFIYSESGKPEAEKGRNDDAVISVAIGMFVLMNDKGKNFKFINSEDFGGSGSIVRKRETIYDQAYGKQNPGVTLNFEDTTPQKTNLFELVTSIENINYEDFMR